VGFWRTLGYIFSGLIIVGGFILVAFGASVGSQMSFQTAPYGNTLNQLGGLAIIYGGVSSIVLGILMIWALVKSGQIESIDKNIKIIAEWITSQKDKEGNSVDNEKFLEDEQRKLDADEKYLAELERKKQEKEKQDSE
jgi:hypothetical protein